MRIMIDIGHPAHVHYFKNFIKIMESKGHEFFIIAKDRNITHELIEHYGIKYTARRDYPGTIFLKLLNIPLTDIMVTRNAVTFKPDILIGFSGTHIAHAGFFLRIPSIVIDDTDHAKFAHASYAPFAKTILTPSCFGRKFGRKQLLFDGYMELCYLHPKYFQPDRRILKDMDIGEGQRYFILRFVSWVASHDIGSKGISYSNKVSLVTRLSRHGKVLISSEKPLPAELEPYRFSVAPHKMHDAIAFASLLYGESATMASEAAILGVPAIFVDNKGRCYTREQADSYGAVFNYTESEEDQAKSIEKAVDLAQSTEGQEKWSTRREDIIKDKIDVTAFLMWFVENYPASVQTMKSNSYYQYTFR